MGSDLLALSGTAIAVGVTHTLLGPDHYVPLLHQEININKKPFNS